MLRTAYRHPATFPISAADLAPLDTLLGAMLERPQPGLVQALRRARRNIARLPVASALSPAARIVVAQCNNVPAGEMGCTHEWVSFWLGPRCCEFSSGDNFSDPLGVPEGTTSSVLVYTCHSDGHSEGSLSEWFDTLAHFDPKRVELAVELG